MRQFSDIHCGKLPSDNLPTKQVGSHLQVGLEVARRGDIDSIARIRQ